MGLPKNKGDVLLGQQIQHESRDEVTVVLGKLLHWRTAVAQADLGPGTELSKPISGETYHRWTEIDPMVDGSPGNVLGEKLESETSGPTTEFEHVLCPTELAMLDDEFQRTVFVKRLGIQPFAEAIVNVSGFFSGEDFHRGLKWTSERTNDQNEVELGLKGTGLETRFNQRWLFHGTGSAEKSIN